MSTILADEETLTRASADARRRTRDESASCQRPIRVVVAEDSYPIREFLTVILSSTPAVELAAVCSDGNELRKAIAAAPPDVVVTDIWMPPSGAEEGIRVARNLRETHPEIGVVVLSQYAEPAYALGLFDGGTGRRAYLLKERIRDREELIGAIEKVAKGGSVIDPLVVDVLIQARSRASHSRLAPLTSREREVLAEIAAGKSNAAIAESLVLTKRAVEKHVNSIFSKLDLPDTEDVSRRVKATLLFLDEQDDDSARPKPPQSGAEGWSRGRSSRSASRWEGRTRRAQAASEEGALSGARIPKASDYSSRANIQRRDMNYKTIRLSTGRHTSPGKGACVMELASMLAGEPFSDHPQSACPVIGSFLRAYNDRVNDERRQDLYRYAAELVGTRSSRIVEQARADRLAAWGRDMWARRWTRRFAPSAWRMVGIERQPPRDLLGVHAVRAIWRVDDQTHAAALALIDELLAIRNDVSDLPSLTSHQTYSVA